MAVQVQADVAALRPMSLHSFLNEEDSGSDYDVEDAYGAPHTDAGMGSEGESGATSCEEHPSSSSDVGSDMHEG